MKQIMVFMLTLCGMQCVAQTNESKGFIEFIPSFTNLIKDMPYENMLQNNKANNLNYPITTKDNALQQSFYQVGFAVKLYIPLKNNWLLSYVNGASYNEYKGSLSYQVYRPETASYSDVLTDTENIKGYTAELKFGLSKQYYFDSKKRFMFLPEFLLGVDAEGHQGEIYDNMKRTMVQYSVWEANKMRAGGQLDLKFNYRLTNRMGVGLTFERVAQLFYAFSKDELGYETVNEHNGFDVSIGKLTMPKLSLICYFNKAKVNEEHK